MRAALHSLGQVDPAIQAVQVTDTSQTRTVLPKHGHQGETGIEAAMFSLVDVSRDGEHGSHGDPSQPIKPCAYPEDQHVSTVDGNNVGEHGTNGVLSQPTQQLCYPSMNSFDQVCDTEHGTGDVSSQSKQPARVHDVTTSRQEPATQYIDMTATETADVTITLDPGATPFISSSRILGGLLQPDTTADLAQVQQVQAGGVGRLDYGGQDLWDAQVVKGCRVGRDNKMQHSGTAVLWY